MNDVIEGFRKMLSVKWQRNAGRIAVDVAFSLAGLVIPRMPGSKFRNFISIDIRK
jgi:hypothetical protein